MQEIAEQNGKKNTAKSTENELSHLNKDKSKDAEDGVSFEVNTCSRRLILMALGVSSGLIRGLWGIAGVPIMLNR